MNIVGASIGRTAMYDLMTVATINQAVCLIRPFKEFCSLDFLLLFFNSETCKSYMFDKQVDNARANLSMWNISNFVIPFPPLEEQKRIVSKVNELIGFCNTLSQSITCNLENKVLIAETLIENIK